MLCLSLLPATALAEGTSVEINATNFPDENFHNFVSTYDTDGDGTLSATEIENVTGIFCNSQGISNLKGIEYFTALTELDCSCNQLTSLDVGNNTSLQELYCDYNNYKITLRESSTFDLSTLPGFDVNKASDWTGGTVNGNILTFNSDATTVTYTYNCGNNYTRMFKLNALRNHTITFDATGGSVTPASAETNDDGKLSSLPTPTREGYVFVGWYTAAEDGTKVNVWEDRFNGNTTIYAHWTQNVWLFILMALSGAGLILIEKKVKKN